MSLVINLRKMVHRKSAEMCAPSPLGNTAAGAFFVSDKSNLIPAHDIAYLVQGVSTIWNYNADQDAWQPLPNSGAAGTFAAGSCGEFRAVGAPGGLITQTATGGSTTTINTNLTITRNLAGHEIRVQEGAGVGYAGTIKSNTLGANAIITVEVPSGVAFGATTKYQMSTGSLWFFNAGTTAVGFSVYDRATNTWTARSVTGLPTSWGTDAQLVSTGGRGSNNGDGFVNGTATAGAATTLTTSKTMLLNQWANAQIRIMSGTGAGQVRTIASNTAGANGVFTVSAAWVTNPDATSVYRVEGNDEYFYLLGNNAVAMYRFTISTNTWATLAPTAARAGGHGAGATADWVDSVQDADWNDELYGAFYTTQLVKQNGRYIYSFRGAGTNTLDVYDIALNTWYSNILYGQQMETFTTGSSSLDYDGHIYIQKDATGRIYKFDIAKNVLEPLVYNPVPQGAAVAGDKMIMTTFKEGAQKLNYLYTLGNTRAELTRWLIV